MVMKIFLSLLFLTVLTHTDNSNICTLISAHSQSNDCARELAGWENKINVYENGSNIKKIIL